MTGFLKSYADPQTAKEAMRRSQGLRDQGVATPEATTGPGPCEVLFDQIDGATGRALIGADLGPMLCALHRLHQTSLPGLPPFDPLLRIRPRLALRVAPHLLGILDEPALTGAATLHGDLHLGQFIRDRSGAVWIVDLDDLAIGPPEADLANFAAHLATTAPQDGIAGWAGRVCRAWTDQGRALNPAVFDQFLRFALLRRHLKLRETGRPDFEAEILVYLRGNASFSIR